MVESNGAGRLDRIEAILEKMADRLDKTSTTGYLHDERIAHIEANIEQMQEDEKQARAEQRAREARLDQRVDKLVSAIGEYVSRLPAR